MQSRRFATQAGFTLIEIIIVMIIIAILVTLAGGSFVSSQQKGRDAKRKGDLKQMSNALELYLNDHRSGVEYSYPESSGSFEILGCGSDDAPTACNWGDAFQQTLNGAATPTVYMPVLPIDPKGAFSYHYEADADGEWYVLFARLENTNDPSVPKSGDDPMVYDGVDCGGQECNYAISSPNISPTAVSTLVVE